MMKSYLIGLFVITVCTVDNFKGTVSTSVVILNVM